jgi:hypothetical protein
VTGATAFQKATTSGQINQLVRQKFLTLYPNRHRSITKPRGCKDWTTLSRHYLLPDDQILKAVAAKESGFWGCRWGDETRFAVLDIDAGSQYHNELSLVRLRQVLACVGFNRPKIYQSSDSEGWHVYLFMDQWANSQRVQEALKTWLSAQAFEIRTGQLEIFPSNNGLRFPLQTGFAWCDDHGKLVIKRGELATDEALSRFIDDLETSAHNWELCKTLIETQLRAIEETKTNDAQDATQEAEDGFSELFSNTPVLLEVYDKGREYWKTGLTAPNQRHEAILSLGHYLWYGDEREGLAALPGPRRAEQRRRIITEWFERSHNGFCAAINRGDWASVEQDIRRACYWTARAPQKRDYQPYPLTDRLLDRLVQLKNLTVEDLKEANDKREDEARAKIRRAVDHCLAQGMQISRKTLEKLTGCSPNTLRKHGDLWRLFAAGSGVCSSPRSAPVVLSPGSASSCHSQEILRETGFRVLSEPDFLPGVQENEKKRDLEILELEPESEGLGLEVSPPLLSCLAGEPTTCTQHQALALRVPSEALTPGPLLRGIQAVLQEGAGGGLYLFPVVPVGREWKQRKRGPPR